MPDQFFVLLKHWLLNYSPAVLQAALSILLTIAPILLLFPALFALTTVVERKALGRMQNRYGPNRVGIFGLMQPMADALKSLTKEDVVPAAADHVVHFLAPLVLLAVAFLPYAILPFGRNMIAANLDAGVLFFFAIGAISELTVFMAGWSSRNKYSLLGAMRAVAQMISYEVPLLLSSIAVIMAAGSLSTVEIVEKQSGFTGIFPHWYVLTPWGFVGFVLFIIAALAETNRSPFDLPEGESEIIAGYYIEYSGFKFALFFLAEYLGMFAISGLGITLFLGGWSAPLPFLTAIPSWFWFFAKLVAMITGFIWIRGTLPRLRMDQLMNFAWKFMLPMALVVVVAAGAWRFLPAGIIRWLASTIFLAIAYVLLARGVATRNKVAKRTYRFAE
jgi:NADH-quinone oxidoreductase subunit H